MKKLIYLISILFLITSCNNSNSEIDAYGHFEADEIMVSSELPGQLIVFELKKGQHVDSGQFVARIDTQSLYIQLLSIDKKIAATNSKVNILLMQKEVAKAEISGLKKDYLRMKSLVSSGAGKQQDLDRLETQVNVATAKLNTFGTQISGVRKESQYLLSQKALLEYQMSKTSITAPVSGTVLETYTHCGELVGPTRPIAKVADLSVMEFRGYIGERQLSSFTIGQDVTIRIDNQGEGELSYPGVITWVAGQAEFTPKIIQTKKERVNLVYAVLVRVKNDGKIKIGMPGEMIIQ